MSAPAPGYRSLRVWQRALDVAVDAAHLARTLAAAGHERAAVDLPRAAAAVPAHIASGSTAASRADYHRALGAALAAVARLETLVAVAERLAPDAAAACATLLANAADLTRQLRAFTRAIGNAPAGAAPPVSPADQPERPHTTPHAHPTDGLGEPEPAAAVTPGTTAPAATAPAPAVLELTPNSATAPEAAGDPSSADTLAAPMSTRPARARRVRSQPS